MKSILKKSNFASQIGSKINVSLKLILISLIFYVGTTSAQMTVKDKDSHVLMEVKDEGLVGSILIPGTDAAPSDKKDKLYNVLGSLFWNGINVSSGGDNLGDHTATQNINLNGHLLTGGANKGIYVNNSGLVGIGTNSPKTNLHVVGNMIVQANNTGLSVSTGGESVDLYFKEGNTSYSNVSLYYHNFGVGTSKPEATLHVVNTIRVGKDPSYPAVYGEIIHEGSNKGFKINAAAGGGWADLHLQTNGTTKLFVESAGNVGIGTLSPSYKLEVNGSAGKPGGGSWSNSSDIRLKNVLGNYSRGLKDIKKLQPVKFKYKINNPRNLPSDEEYVGFIAQEVKKVFPEAISKGKDGYLDFNMHSINVAMVNAVKELASENKNLLSKVKKLEENYSFLLSVYSELETQNKKLVLENSRLNQKISQIKEVILKVLNEKQKFTSKVLIEN